MKIDEILTPEQLELFRSTISSRETDSKKCYDLLDSACSQINSYAEDAKERPHLYSLSLLTLLRDRKREYRKMKQRIEYWNYMDSYDKNLLK